MKELRLCCAPVSQNQRCKNYAFAESDHCKNHREACRSLYLKYKKIQLRLDKFKVEDPVKIENLLKYYALLTDVYEGRRKHRLIAYSPECYDYGHDKQFEILMTRITECEQLLTDLFQKKDTKGDAQKNISENTISKDNISSRDSSSDISSDISSEISSKNIPTEICKFRNKRKKDQEEDNRLLNEYIEANKDEYSYKRCLIVFIDEIITKLTVCFNAHPSDLTTIKIGISNLLEQLWSNGVFKDDFDLELCPCCSKRPEVISLHALECRCIQRHNRLASNYPFRIFLNQVSIPSLERMANVLNDKLAFICPIISDLSQAYKIHSDKFVKCTFSLIKRDAERYVFNIEESNPDHTKLHDRTFDKWQRTSLPRLKESFEIDKIVDLIKYRDLKDKYED